MHRQQRDDFVTNIDNEQIFYDETLEHGRKKLVAKEFYSVLFKYSWRLAFFFLIGLTFFFSSWMMEPGTSDIIIRLISMGLLTVSGHDILWRVRHDQDLRELLFGGTIVVQKPLFLKRSKPIVKHQNDQQQSHTKFGRFSLSTPATPSFEENFTMPSSHYITPMRLFSLQSEESTTPSDKATKQLQKQQMTRDWKRLYHVGDYYQKRCSICPDCQNSSKEQDLQSRCIQGGKSTEQQAQRYSSLARYSWTPNEINRLLAQEAGGLRRRSRVDYKWLATHF